MEPVLVFAVLAALGLWTAFWVIRLAVRYGTNDALRMNRHWLGSSAPDAAHHPAEGSERH